jgi:invasion protein IalB
MPMAVSAAPVFADRFAVQHAFRATGRLTGSTNDQGVGSYRPTRVWGLMVALLVFPVLMFFWAPTAAEAQPVVRESFEAWQIQCETPPGSPEELCALVQNVAAVDRPNVELRVTIVRTLDGGAHILRVAAPLGVLLDGGLGLRIDDTDIGTADFARCLPSGCYVEMIMEQELVDTFSTGTTAWFVIFQTPDEGIGIPIELAGFSPGFAALD